MTSLLARRTRTFRALPPDPEAWLRQQFPSALQNAAGVPVPFAPHHQLYWAWLWGLRPGIPAAPFIAVWPRGGAKSILAELGCAIAAYFGLRRYGLYLCSSQQQADDHVQNVARFLEQLGVARAINRYGSSRGWRISRLMTEDGFTLDAVGLETMIRGARIEDARPDFLVGDDIDDQADTAAAIGKKIAILSRAILPAGAPSMAVLGVQNLIHPDGIFTRLVDGRADFLLNRVVSGPYPALADLPDDSSWFHMEPTEDGGQRVRIVKGTPTWVGQGIEECELLATQIGIGGFLIECQGRLDRLREGMMFKRHWFTIVADYPRNGRAVRYWDFAATEVKPGNDPDWLVGLKMVEKAGQFWVVDVQRARLSPKGAEDLVAQTAQLDGRGVHIWLEQEPGSSGKIVMDDYQRRVLKGFTVSVERPTGAKPERAKPVSSAAEAGNVFLVEGSWNTDFLDEVVPFPGGSHDDQVDTLSGAHTALAGQGVLSISRL